MMMIRRSAQVRRAMHPGRRPQPSLFRSGAKCSVAPSRRSASPHRSRKDSDKIDKRGSVSDRFVDQQRPSIHKPQAAGRWPIQFSEPLCVVVGSGLHAFCDCLWRYVDVGCAVCATLSGSERGGAARLGVAAGAPMGTSRSTLAPRAAASRSDETNR